MEKTSAQPVIAVETLKHAVRPVQEAQAAYLHAYAAVKAAASLDKATALNTAKRAQQVYNEACRRLYSYVRQAIDNEEAAVALARRMGLLIEDDRMSPPLVQHKGNLHHD